MYRRAMRGIPALGLLVALLAFVAGACGGASGDEARGRYPLPEGQQALHSGTYLSKDFEPSLSLKVQRGWRTSPPETFDALRITRVNTGGLSFTNLAGARFYKATRTGLPYAVDVPEDIVSWFQRHPYLQTDKPREVTVGGVPGEQFDVLVRGLPQDYSAMCGTDCVDIARLSSGSLMAFGEANRGRLIVLEDVKGESLIIDFGGPAARFDEFAPEAQKVIDTVKWERS